MKHTLEDLKWTPNHPISEEVKDKELEQNASSNQIPPNNKTNPI